VIIDIGANLGISTMGFRQMGFKNKIYIFEPNPFIFNKYLIKLKKKIKIFFKKFCTR
jgi:FkbM family methyltransferase